MRTHRFFGRVIPEFVFLLFALLERVRDGLDRSAAPNRGRKRAERRRELLRTLLTEYPLWALGHVRLGLAEVEIQSYSNSPIAPRSLSTVRLSREAAAVILEGEAAAGRYGRALCEAAFLRVQEELYRKSFESALTQLEWVLQPEHAVQLSSGVYYAALDHAANICLILDRREDSSRYRALVPARYAAASSL